jgi:hypothetical protein
MVLIPVRGLAWQQEQVTTCGTTAPGQQRSRSHHTDWPQQSCVRDPASTGRLPAITQHVRERRLNASGVRDTARGVSHWLHLSNTTNTWRQQR